jgi:hypothetical protein
MTDRIICANSKLRKNEVRGSMAECAERGKIYYWGIHKADEKIYQDAKKKKKQAMTIQKARLKMIALKANIGAIERKIDDIKHRSKEKKKESDVSEIEELKKKLSEKIKEYNESVKLVKKIEEEKEKQKQKKAGCKTECKTECISEQQKNVELILNIIRLLTC